ncbi:MAG: hypothetical protein QXL94_07090, partial [Candidatus Parvarchaeum sp.]
SIQGCSLKGVYVNLKGYYNNNSFLELRSINNPVFLVNNSVKNLSLYLSGNNPLIYYYNALNLNLTNTSNASVEELNLTKYFHINLGFIGNQRLNFSLLEGKSTIFSGPEPLKLQSFNLIQGKYSLLFNNGSDNYTYNLYVGPNCLGYENITILPGRSYYIYDSLNISSIPFTVYKTNQLINTVNNYQVENSCNSNISVLINLDKSILSGLFSINNSIYMASNSKINYTSILDREINYTNYVLNTYDTKLIQKPNTLSFNQSGLTVLSYYNKGNFTKEVLKLDNNGTINLSYGTNSRMQIIVTTGNTPNIFVTTEKDIMKAFSYVPSLFLGFLGGL